MIESLNFLSATIPIALAVGAFVLLKERSVIIAVLCSAAIITIFAMTYTYSYKAIGFPLYMEWFASDA